MSLKGLTIAHRGIFDNKEVAENSLTAFKRAKELNIPIELDVQLTKDQTLVVFHDINLKRMCGIDKYLEDTTYQELQTLTLLTTKEKIPTLNEVLNLIQGKVRLDIEIKKLDTEHSALEKELESIKGVMQKNTERSFSAFS